HLVANGDQRSLVLFGGIGIWAVVAMLSINRRDGEWEKPAPLAPMAYIKPVVAGVVAYVLLALAHPYIAGISAFPG
ncbi:MAG: NnrU protein, partial [Deltaproteobacteria bacterium]|nr:NnrU protein [Deltaproteobacteria bacterium]